MRSIWSGTISFGLIHIPVKLYKATQPDKLPFRYLRKEDLCPIQYQKVCSTDGEIVPYEDIVKGFEYKSGEFVVLNDNDFRKASVHKTQSLNVQNFVGNQEIAGKYYEKPYYLEPTDHSQKAYTLLRDALKETERLAIVQYVLKSKEHLGVLVPEGDMLMLNQLRFVNQLQAKDDLNLPKKGSFSDKEFKMTTRLIKQMTTPFKPEKYKDSYTENLRKVVADKVKGKKVKTQGRGKPIPTEAEDIMIKLKESLEYVGKK